MGGGGGGGGMPITNFVSSTGHSVHMRGLPFKCTQQDIIDVSKNRFSCQKEQIFTQDNFHINNTFIGTCLQSTQFWIFL